MVLNDKEIKKIVTEYKDMFDALEEYDRTGKLVFNKKRIQEVLHYPKLDTILMVEGILQKADLAISKNELLRRLPKQVMRQTLNVILDYLEEKGKIMIGEKGVLWIYNPSLKLRRAIEKGVEI